MNMARLAFRYLVLDLFIGLAIMAGTDCVWAQAVAEAKPDVATDVEYWHGTLKAGPIELRLVVILEPQADGAWKGKLISVDQGNSEMPFDTVTKKEGLEFEVKAISAKYNGKAGGDKKTIEGTFSQSGNNLPLKLVQGSAPVADKVKEAWVGGIKVGDDETQVQLRIIESDQKEIVRFDDLTSGVMGITAVIKPSETGLKFDVSGIGGSFEGKWNATKDAAEGTWKQGGGSFPLTLKKKLTGAEGPIEVKRPQTPQEPFPYVIEKVTFPSFEESVTLAGTLTVPSGKGPFPAVILVSGSGPQDRDEMILGHRPFWVLADHLSRKGIAVLRYDDRGTAQSTGDFGSSTSADFAKDARGALAHLRSDARIDPKRLGIVGHSEGGLIATMLAATDEPLSHVVLMAGPGGPGDVIIESQTRAISLASGLPDAPGDLDALKALLKAIKEEAPQETIDKLMAQAAKGNDPAASDGDEVVEGEEGDTAEAEKESGSEVLMTTLKMFDSPWFRYFLKYDPRVDLQKAKCPVLAVIGEKDLQVLVDVNLPEIEKAVADAPAKGSRCVRMPDHNHLFQVAKRGTPQEYRILEQTLSPDFMTLVEEWILSH